MHFLKILPPSYTRTGRIVRAFGELALMALCAVCVGVSFAAKWGAEALLFVSIVSAVVAVLAVVFVLVIVAAAVAALWFLLTVCARRIREIGRFSFQWAAR